MFRLNNNVFVVKGASQSCIYDLNNKKLYCISNKFADFMLNINSFDEIPDTIANSRSMHELINEKIVVRDNDSKYDLKVVKQPSFSEGTIEITQNCNFKCVHCFEGVRLNKSIPLVEVKRIMDQFCEIGISNIHFFGGEPFIHPDFAEMLYYAKDKFRLITVTTNASILNKKIEECLIDVKPMILASLHSDIEEEFNRVTNTNGMFAVVNNNIKRMKELGINCQIRKVKINGIRSSENYEEYWSEHSGFPILLGNAEIGQYSKEMLRKKIITKKHFEKLLDVDSVLQNMNYQKCFCKNLYIDVEENVYPCTMERRIKHGNISEKKLMDVLKQSITRITKEKINECRDCEYRFTCSTCFVDNRSNNPYDKPWFCLYDPYSGEWNDEEIWIEKALTGK